MYDLPTWVDSWEGVLGSVLEAVPASRGRLLIDLINEPDAYNLTWAGAADPGAAIRGSRLSPAARTPLGDFYLAALDRLAPLCRECLFLVEGGGQAREGWGRRAPPPAPSTTRPPRQEWPLTLRT